MTAAPTPPEQPVDPEDLVPLPHAIGQLDTGDPLALPDLVVSIKLGAEVVDDLQDPHALTTKPYPWGVAWTCACGRWEAVATGPSSAGFAERSYARHRAEEEAGARGE